VRRCGLAATPDGDKMIRSMTGFARRERTAPFGTLAWELRTVNHRYLEVTLRLPEEFRPSEGEFRQAIAGLVRRGKVEAALYFRATPGRRRLADAADINVVDLLRWPGVLREAERDTTPQLEAAHELLAEALAALTESRGSEGGRIAELLLGRCGGVEAIANEVSSRLPEIRERIRARLNDRLSQVAVEPNPDRLEQEIVIALQKMDVDEELDRLRSHVVEMRKVIDADEPAGRRLDFLMQEFNREANTLSSKSQDVETTRAAVDMKVLIEQMREQVQNVE
jgi:uncharacterized protein (TIGR00255 family)